MVGLGVRVADWVAGVRVADGVAGGVTVVVTMTSGGGASVDVTVGEVTTTVGRGLA